MKISAIGQLRQQVVLLQPSTTVDAVGQPSTDFNSLGTRWARIQHTAGSEEFTRAAQQFAPKATHVVSLRNDSLTRQLTALHWFSWTPWGSTTAKLLDIRWIDYGERRQEGIRFYCVERLDVQATIAGGTPWIPGTPLQSRSYTGAINGSNTVFTLAVTPPASASVLCVFNGTVQPQSSFTVSGATVTLSWAPKPASPGFPADTLEFYF